MKTQPLDNTDAIFRSQLDKYFASMKRIIRPVPKVGWIAQIRKSLLMTTAQLARRLGIPQSNVSIFEKAERNKKITLESLERIADAMECDLHYTLIPRRGLQSTLSERVRNLYQRDQKMLDHQMRLEGQGTTKSDKRKALEMAMLIINKDKRIWED